MSNTIAVVGATGQQGGSVARACIKAGWKVRGVTRKVDSDSAKALIAEGAEVISANLNDEASLIKAFEVFHALVHSKTIASNSRTNSGCASRLRCHKLLGDDHHQRS